MGKRTILLAGAAACAAVVFTAGESSAQSKKQPRAGTNTFQQCCEKAYARYALEGGKDTCIMQGDQQKDAFNQCVHQRGIRTTSPGQQAG